jgi:putative phage-type endonuclease
MAWIPTEELVEALGVAKLIGRYRSGTAEWHEARKGVGGSDVGAICGVNPYRSQDQLIEQRNSGEQIEPNLAMKLGTHLEGGIRRLWREENAAFLDVYDTGTWANLERPTWKANPDGLIQYHNGDLGILEIKYTSRKWEKVPEYYRYQVLWYMRVLGLKSGILVQVHGHNLTEWSIPYDEDTIKDIERHVGAFEQRINKGD